MFSYETWIFAFHVIEILLLLMNLLGTGLSLTSSLPFKLLSQLGCDSTPASLSAQKGGEQDFMRLFSEMMTAPLTERPMLNGDRLGAVNADSDSDIGPGPPRKEVRFKDPIDDERKSQTDCDIDAILDQTLGSLG
jgi:hypothetical protein